MSLEHTDLSLHVYFQLKKELGRIINEDDISKDMKSRFSSLWKPKLLAVMKASRHKEVARIVEQLEDAECANEAQMQGTV